MIYRSTLFALVTGAALCGAATAQGDTATWTGEGSLSAGTTTGNTETTDFAAGLKAEREVGVWTLGLGADAQYGETNSLETSNRVFLSGNLDRQINDRLFVFGNTTYEKDQFSGYDYRHYIGAGLGYQILVDEPTTWNVRGGLGLRTDEFDIPQPNRETSQLGATARSEFAHAFSESVSLSNDTGIVFTQESTQITNSLGLTSKLTDALSARFSFDIRHDTDPLPSFESTDTATRFSIVYGF